MRIKNFTLMTLALLMMSVVAFAQKAPTKEAIAQQKETRAMALAKEKFGAIDLNHKVLPQFAKKAKSLNLPAGFKVQNGPKKTPMQARLENAKRNAKTQVKASSTVKAEKLLSPVWGQGSFTTSLIGNRTAPEGSVFYDDFESGDLSQWTLKTLNEGDGWMPGTPAAYDICDAHSGTYVASSWSWNTNPYNVDNWLITPKVALGGSVVFWTYTHAEYPDKYEVLLSTTGTETTDFTVTLRELSADAGGAWEQKVIDLSAYAGQEGYIAIHHKDYDDNYLFIDDFAVTEEPYVGPTPVTPPTGLTTMQFTMLAYAPDSEGEFQPFERVLTIGIDGTDVYVQGVGYYMPEAWIKGTMSHDGTVTFATGQYYGIVSGTQLYFQAYDYNAQAPLDNLTLTFNALTGSITWPSVLIMDCGTPTGLDELYNYYEVDLVVPGTEPAPLTPPAGIESNLVEYRMEGDAYNADGSEYGEYSEPVFIGIDGDDVWVKGVCIDLPDAWIKGTKNGDTITFPTGQNLGVVSYYGYTFKYFFGGYDFTSYAQADVTMTLDSNTGIYTMTSPDIALINSSWLAVDPNLFFTTLQFVPVPDVAATPAQPTITGATLENTTYPSITVDIPTTDVNGNPLLTSKLSYQYYYDVNKVVNPLTLYTSDYTKLTADMTEIPYSFCDDYDVYNYRLYLNQDFSTWNKIGIQSIYRGGGDEKRSEIFWYTIIPYPHEVTFVAANDLSIQNGKATVQVDGTKATVDADGKLTVPETYTVTLTAANGYKFVSVTSTGATVELDQNGFVATFEMPENDVTVNYEMRELYNPIQFTTTGEYTIQDGQATVTVNGDDVTENIDETGQLIDIPTDATVTITAEPGFKLTNVTASYTEKSAGGPSGELTVYDGTTTNGRVPVYGFYADAYNKCEFVMPASVLTGMSGSNISAMKFYTSESAVNWGDAQFQVFMKEVTDETISAFSGPGTVVYEGALSIENGEMNVEFTTPYTYNGGNLLIGFYQPVTGKYVSAQFYGETVTGASISGYSYSSIDAISATQRDFLPKTTFTYASGSGGGAFAEVQVGSGDLIKNYLPTYNLYNYSVTQQIYTASEIGQAGSINSIAYYCTSNARARNLDIYLVHTSKDAFDSTTDWIVVSESDKVFSGNVDFAYDAWTTITLDKPFNYNGTDNLCVIVDDNTGNWHPSMQFKVYDATNQSIVIYDDNTNYEISSISSFEGYFKTWKNQMVLGMSTAPAIDLDVNLAADGNSASFTVPEGTVTVNYELVRLGYSINVPADTYITYYTDKDITVYDSDVELLTVTAVSATEATVTPLTVVAAETPMLIHNSSNAEKTLWIVPTEETHDKPAADVVTVAPEFKGTLTAKEFTDADMAAKDHYVCTGKSFVWVRNAGSIGANKCWLEVDKTTTQGAPSLIIGYGNGNDATGIAPVTGKADAEVGQWYDLNGRKLNAAPTQKGVYVINGKKVVIK